MDEILTQLEEICGKEHVTNEKVDLCATGETAALHRAAFPAMSAGPKSTEEVVKLVKLANRLKKPLFLWGRATTFVDNGVVNNCIVLALDLMNDFEMDLENQVVHAETGAIWHAHRRRVEEIRLGAGGSRWWRHVFGQRGRDDCI